MCINEVPLLNRYPKFNLISVGFRTKSYPILGNSPFAVIPIVRSGLIGPPPGLARLVTRPILWPKGNGDGPVVRSKGTALQILKVSSAHWGSRAPVASPKLYDSKNIFLNLIALIA